MICKKCGKELPVDTMICPSCGEDNNIESLVFENVETLENIENTEILDSNMLKETDEIELVNEQNVIPTTETALTEEDKKNMTTLSVTELMDIKNNKLPMYTKLDFVNEEDKDVNANQLANYDAFVQSEVSPADENKNEKKGGKFVTVILVFFLVVMVSLGLGLGVLYSDTALSNKKLDEPTTKEVTFGIIKTQIPTEYEVETGDNSIIVKNGENAIYIAYTEGNINHFIDDIDEVAYLISDHIGDDAEYDETIAQDGKYYYMFYLPSLREKVFIVDYNSKYYFQGTLKYKDNYEFNSVMETLKSIIKSCTSEEIDPEGAYDKHYDYVPNLIVGDLTKKTL